ncbi:MULTISPECIES: mechanosensitive ion channel domain-containing protein [unclassified Microcoleus]|uniref:mechanosensitive ion channel domain-containing protein n=1 Tax=unclassified Microcoleus TaxID=2642155 RepID=UPI001D5B6997|nr:MULTISPECIES: mechanosensitive ion channel domain-containing protein [unclassified Microcoleus]MCC3468472.1 mechanosensitive ion channel [Microcoleus sp. PH2017_06_SFM_O_A]TAE16543.1 MAG: mechanosensitive ion channel protein MscS [Oscillatoriales cyanobacterium]MCC3410690.1 mechanosensitive ion channel [Microcoleus sp. PH2017_02_FOX_O_A]MCC3471284.1 mechanosensitive ion channel [Microcoleus sp. PH2017_13_LAR_U_A]MCC3483990.1 mechanosensitive ion channel [Microcoleus sp. PH2017_14_LAR_D_A]
MNTVPQELLTNLFQLFTATLFKIGENSVSLRSLLELIISFMIVLIVSRTFTDFLKERLLVKLGIDEGNQEAIAVILRYLIIALGVIIAIQGIGFNLASFAVIAGGLGVGIGFGIQDLTTNFVSGLTLLLDRPVKVGDFVELEGLMGVVKKISIRSTIIKTNDDSSVIVPNSNMISNKIVNRSYENSTLCLRLSIKVDGNSDPLLVTETLLNIAYTEAGVLYEPNPKVLFAEFGNDCFKFELLVWTDRPTDREVIKSSLNFAIEYHFRQEEINFPFNVKTSNKLAKRMLFVGEESKQLSSLSSLLRQVKYFETLNDIELRQLMEVGYRQRLQSQEFLFRENDPGDAFYMILSGSVEVFIAATDKELTHLGRGKFFGTLSLILGIPRTTSVKALEETIVFAINKEGLQKILERPYLSERIIQEIVKHEELKEKQQQLREMELVDVQEEDEVNPVDWVRKRLKNLFSVSS